MNTLLGAGSLAMLGLFAVSACSQEPAEPEIVAATTVPDEKSAPAPARAAPTFDYERAALAAVENPARPTADLSDDAARRPADILPFFQIEPGDTVLELEAASGWYTELLSHLVGPDGKLIMQNPAYFKTFPSFEESVAERLRGNRLPNVVASESQFDELEADTDSVDVVTWILGPHELFYQPEGTDGFGDPETAFAEIVRVLKPDGHLIVLDHAAPPGAPASTGGETHRIDPQIVIDLAEGAGLEVAAENTLLRSGSDDYTKSVFDPAVRRKTDRFLLRFQVAASEATTG